jgi:hypothetical protein
MRPEGRTWLDWTRFFHPCVRYAAHAYLVIILLPWNSEIRKGRCVMEFIELKKDIYLALIVLGLILLFIGIRMAHSAFGADLAGTILFLVVTIQGSVCFGFGAFTWLLEEDPEIWN